MHSDSSGAASYDYNVNIVYECTYICTFPMSYVRYASKKEQDVFHQFLIFLVECKLVNDVIDKGGHMNEHSIMFLFYRRFYSPMVHFVAT